MLLFVLGIYLRNMFSFVPKANNLHHSKRIPENHVKVYTTWIITTRRQDGIMGTGGEFPIKADYNSVRLTRKSNVDKYLHGRL